MEKNLGVHYNTLVKQNLRRLKGEKSWTIPQMAMHLELSESYMGQLLSFKSKYVPSVYLIGQICEKVNLTYDYFFQEVAE